jgi:iron complex transport system permease protein
VSGRSAPGNRPLVAALVLGAVLVVLLVLGVRAGSTGTYGFGESLRGLLAALGLADGLERTRQTIVELRLHRTLVAVGVGGALALSGGLLQGLFRNGLASPSLVGVTAGAGLGASVAILAIGGYGVDLAAGVGGFAPFLVTGASFVGAIVAALLVLRLASRRGRISVPGLLLVGIAMNQCMAGVLVAVQSWTLRDYEVHRAILAWTFGTLEDRAGYHVAMVWGGLAIAAASIPFVATELDLFAAGEEDAHSLGVDTTRVKLLALLGAALAAACAVAVAGQIAFVGLVVPHLLRLTTGSSHRALLPLCVLGGGVFLLAADIGQRTWLAGTAMQPGILMSLIGGPFFLYLVWRNRRGLEAW